jgi:hypothetical protein
MAAIASISQLPLPYDFYHKKTLEVKFSGLDLSSDAGFLLLRQTEEQERVCDGIAACLDDNRDPSKITHTLNQLVSQRIYQIAAGYEDANDSNDLRHDPILKIACERVPIPGEELLASQPTMCRLENQVTKAEIDVIRRFFVDKFIRGYTQAPQEILLDIDAWDAQTHGHQQLSLFHGYYGHKMYFPVLINEAQSGYPLIMQLRAGNSHSGKGLVSILRWLFWALPEFPWSPPHIV